MNESSLVKAHQPCPDCKSHDAMSIYTDHTFCFSCSTRHWKDGKTEIDYEPFERRLERMEEGKIREIADRCLTEETCRKFGVRSLVKDHRIQKHFYPYFNSSGVKIAEKTRVVDTKQFFWSGDNKDVALFGAQCQPTTGRFVVVCEGEIDCLTMWQVLGGRNTCVSIPNGCRAAKAIKDNYEYLNKFDNIIICFDGDGPGKESAEKIAQILPPRKTKVMKFSADLKDPNAMLMAGKTQELVNLFWRAEEYRPEDIINIGDMFDRLSDYRKTHEYTPTPWVGLNDMVQGTRPGQLIVMAAGTGMGKSAFLKSWMYHLVQTTDKLIGALYLEENPEETVISLMSLAAGMNLKKNQVWDSCNQEDLKKFFETCGANRRIELFEPLNNTEPDYVCNKIRYLAVARGCKFIFLDHLTYLVDDSDDPRRALNRLVKMLHDLCVELDIVVIAACHLRKSATSQRSSEEGGRVTLDDLKDSSSVKQLSDIVIGIERNSQDPDKDKANTSILRVLKNRDFGQKGPATALYYETDTTRLVELSVEEVFNKDVEDI